MNYSAQKAQWDGGIKEYSEGRTDIPSIDVVEVREEEDSTDEKSDQHKSPIHFVQESVLLFVLRAEKNRERSRERDRLRVEKQAVQFGESSRGYLASLYC